MGRKDPRVDRYIERSAPFARPILRHVRRVVHVGCPQVEETMKWSFPHFMYKGMLGSMASFKEHCAFGFWKEALLGANGGPLALEQKKAMGQFGRLTKVADLPSDAVLLDFVERAVALNDQGIKSPKKSRPSGSRTLEVPDYFLAALRGNRKALATFEGFAYSHRKEYVDWVTEAKRAETRERRIAQAVEWLAEGKERSWKYVCR